MTRTRLVLTAMLTSALLPTGSALFEDDRCKCLGVIKTHSCVWPYDCVSCAEGVWNFAKRDADSIFDEPEDSEFCKFDVGEFSSGMAVILPVVLIFALLVYCTKHPQGQTVIVQRAPWIAAHIPWIQAAQSVCQPAQVQMTQMAAQSAMPMGMQPQVYHTQMAAHPAMPMGIQPQVYHTQMAAQPAMPMGIQPQIYHSQGQMPAQPAMQMPAQQFAQPPPMQPAVGGTRV